MSQESTQKPKFGWSVKMDHVFPYNSTQDVPVRFWQILPVLPMFLRYLLYFIWNWFKGKTVIMNFLKPENSKRMSGVPFGGIGGGSIGRGWKGEFCQYHMRPGVYYYTEIPANQFIVTIRNKGKTLYQKVLSPNGKPADGSLSKWSWMFPGDLAEYTGLFPRSWTEYSIPEHKVKLTCRQISPVIPHNYKDSSLPGGVFVWEIENASADDLEISVTFTFQNGVGTDDDSKGECKSNFFEDTLNEQDGHINGVTINQSIYTILCSYTLAAVKKAGVNVTRCPYFDPKGNGESIWDEIESNGKFTETDKQSHCTRDGEVLGVAVCTQTTVTAGSSNTIEFSLVWDMPIIMFGGINLYTRYYTKFFGNDGNAGPVMTKYALSHYKEWEDAIFQWQKPILDDITLPDWYKSALFNETYYIVDGGTIWFLTDATEDFANPKDPRLEYGHFGYLEGHEYKMYNTYDVHFYASFALAMLWPNLQASLQYDFRDTVFKEDKSKTWFLYNGDICERKKKGSIPHDLGTPADEPFYNVNAYNIHDISEWKDLNLKFVLQCFRDYSINKSVDYLKDMWPQLEAVVTKALLWDLDGDGLIENSDFPDQTYDSWRMRGCSAYCGSLWIAVLTSMCTICEILGKNDSKVMYNKILYKAKHAFEQKLWNGQYYDFDSSKSERSSTIMADQLCGLWYLHACGITEEALPKENIKSVMTTIYEMNVMKFCNGSMGAVNGMKPDGIVDLDNVQSEEVWTGVSYGIAAFMIHEGMLKEGFQVAHGIYNTVYNETGLAFQTPEALYVTKAYRSLSYMRPLAIWATQIALKSLNTPKKEIKTDEVK